MDKNRRKYQRIDIDLLTDYRGDIESDLKRSFVKNISEGGVCVVLDHELKPSTDVRINFNMPTMTSKPIEIFGTVVWKKSIQDEAGYVHGVVFTDVPIMYEEIIQYIKNLVYDMRRCNITTTGVVDS